MIAAHLPILQVIIPLFIAPVALIIRNSRTVWILSLSVTWVTFIISLALLVQVVDSGNISYRIGGWAAPWGIEYVLDKVGAFVLVIVSAIGSIVMTYARQSVEAEIPDDRIYLFYTMFLLCLTGLLGIVITGDVFNLFVFLEISSLSSYVMISLGRDRRALTAAFVLVKLGQTPDRLDDIGLLIHHDNRSGAQPRTQFLEPVEIHRRVHDLSSRNQRH